MSKTVYKDPKDIQVNEAKRTIYFIGGGSETFTGVTWFNPYGEFLRFGCDQGYILVNTANIKYIRIAEAERVNKEA